MPGTDEPPLTRFDLRSDDPAVADAAMGRSCVAFEVRSRQASPVFRFARHGVSAPGFTVVHHEYRAVARLTSPAPRDLVVSTVETGRLTVDQEDDVVGPVPGTPTLLPTGDAGWVVDVDDVGLDSLVLDRSAVERAAASAFGARGSRLTFSSGAPSSVAAQRYWSGVVDHVRRDVLADDGLATPLVLAEAARALATAVLVTFRHSWLTAPSDGQPARPGPEPAVLRRATAFVDEYAGEPIGVDDIAAAARIGVRGLQHHFRTYRDCTPLDYLRRVRMARAHADLQAGDPSRGDTVAAIAARWGFTHPGRFSVAYRRIEGRPPSHTLRS